MDKYDYREQTGTEETKQSHVDNFQRNQEREHQILTADDMASRWKPRSDIMLHRREEMGDTVDAPECGREDCYNCIEGRCVALNDNNFGHRECPFFIRTEQAIENQKASLKRLIDEGREDLLKKYGSQLAALDIVELGDIELEQMFTGLRSIEYEMRKKAEERYTASNAMTDEKIGSPDPEEISASFKNQRDALFGGRAKGSGTAG